MLRSWALGCACTTTTRAFDLYLHSTLCQLLAEDAAALVAVVAVVAAVAVDAAISSTPNTVLPPSLFLYLVATQSHFSLSTPENDI